MSCQPKEKKSSNWIHVVAFLAEQVDVSFKAKRDKDLYLCAEFGDRSAMTFPIDWICVKQGRKIKAFCQCFSLRGRNGGVANRLDCKERPKEDETQVQREKEKERKRKRERLREIERQK